jgi:hypothetical protein
MRQKKSLIFNLPLNLNSFKQNIIGARGNILTYKVALVFITQNASVKLC